jgi:hypothetical protein
MTRQETVANRILKAVRRIPGCQLDDVEHSCPELSWNLVFLEFDRLTRTRQVRVTPKSPGTYVLTVQPKSKRITKPK